MSDNTCQKELENLVRDKDYQTVQWWTGEKHELDKAWLDDNTAEEFEAAQEAYEQWGNEEPEDETTPAWQEWMDREPLLPEENYNEEEELEPGGHVMDDTYIVSGNGTLLGVELVTTTGGPHIYLDTRGCRVVGKWWGMYAEAGVEPRMASAVYDYWAELWESKKLDI